MNIDQTTSWPLMILIALGLGLRHGLDLDHLATIDAIARTTKERGAVSKMAGFLFSLGHGCIVTAVSLVIGGGLIEASTPDWLEELGNMISLFFLGFFGVLNLWSVFQSSSSATPKGIKSYVVKKILHKNLSPSLIILIGALFALSFDTFSQIALFSISATLMSGLFFSGLLGFCFMLGMMLTDGFNGLFVSKLIQRADRASSLFSKGLGLFISLFSLILFTTGLMKLFK